VFPIAHTRARAQLNCKAATVRFREGVPADHASSGDAPKTIAEAVQFFITAMDSLKLNMTAVDHIQVSVCVCARVHSRLRI
jgi:hypothetical protein